MNGYELAMTCLQLGAGRQKVSDKINHSSGMNLLKVRLLVIVRCLY